MAIKVKCPFCKGLYSRNGIKKHIEWKHDKKTTDKMLEDLEVIEVDDSSDVTLQTPTKTIVSNPEDDYESFLDEQIRWAKKEFILHRLETKQGFKDFIERKQDQPAQPSQADTLKETLGLVREMLQSIPQQSLAKVIGEMKAMDEFKDYLRGDGASSETDILMSMIMQMIQNKGAAQPQKAETPTPQPSTSTKEATLPDINSLLKNPEMKGAIQEAIKNVPPDQLAKLGKEYLDSLKNKK